MYERAILIRSTAAAVLFTLLVPACSPPPVPPAPGPPAVTVTTPIRRTVVNSSVFTGRTEARKFVEIRARVPGYLEEMKFTPGTEIEAGDVLFTIEDESYLAHQEQARASLESAKAKLARAAADLSRVEEAVKTNAVSVQDVDQRKADRDVAQAAVQEAKAALRQADLNLSYCEVTSPIAGQVSRNYVDVGNLVGSGQNTLLATVANMNPMYAYFELDEKVLARWLVALRDKTPGSRGMKGFLGIADDLDFPHEGVIDYGENTVDSSTGTVIVRGTFPNDERLLYPGLFARIKIPGEEVPNAMLVREEAIGTDLGGKYLLVVGDENVVDLKHVTLGALEKQYRVVLEGLEESDRYIYEGQLRARPGFPCAPTDGAPDADATEDNSSPVGDDAPAAD
jgi:RND family efflux transporter MFP subunit